MTTATYYSNHTGLPVIVEAPGDPSLETLDEMGRSVDLLLVKVTRVTTGHPSEGDTYDR